MLLKTPLPTPATVQLATGAFAWLFRVRESEGVTAARARAPDSHGDTGEAFSTQPFATLQLLCDSAWPG